jgi:hypothetical protein
LLLLLLLSYNNRSPTNVVDESDKQNGNLLVYLLDWVSHFKGIVERELELLNVMWNVGG